MKIYQKGEIQDPDILNGLDQVFRCSELSIVENPKGTYPQFDFYPLAKRSTSKIEQVIAVLTDMDGTTTTTEDLCLHSQEYMLQKVMNNTEFQLDKVADYPNIIGNSTTKHVEYLIGKYSKYFKKNSIVKQALLACKWTIKNSKDPKRFVEARSALAALQSKSVNLLHLCIEIYYCRYHQILEEIKNGNSNKIAKEVLGGKPPIAPMDGIAQMLCLTKGLLGNEASKVISVADINSLSEKFENKPVKIALVTSSIFYEADIVLGEVFKMIQAEVMNWDITEERKKLIKSRFNDYAKFYDAVVTADDSNEIRLKPHRDLYTIALRKLNIEFSMLNKTIGFEDSESGLLALRAAGIGKAIALPFHGTSNHNLKPATVIAQKGILQFIEKYRFFLRS